MIISNEERKIEVYLDDGTVHPKLRGTYQEMTKAGAAIVTLVHELKPGQRLYALIEGNAKKLPNNSIATRDEIPADAVAVTCTDFGNPRRFAVLAKHLKLETAARQYWRHWKVYHKLHGELIWLQLPNEQN